MKKIFILKGGENTNKTTIINTVAEWIINNYGIPNTIGLDSSNLKKDTFGVLQVGKLNIGFNSAGDTLDEVKKIDKLNNLNDNDIDIIVCACRTKGKGRTYLLNNYNYSNAWLLKFINSERYPLADTLNQSIRNTRKIDELKTWLIGLEKP